MALKDRLTSDAPTNGTPCSVGRAIKGLPPAELEVFLDLLGTPERRGKSAAYIYDMMQAERRDLQVQAEVAALERRDRPEAERLRSLAEVYNVGYQTINRHRGGNCRCSKDAA